MELDSKIVCLLHIPVGNPELVVVAGGTTGVEVRGRPIGDSLSASCSCLLSSHLKGVYVL